MIMAISVAVPKDLSGIKTKVAMNLTKRQLICFGGAGAVGIPLYIFTKGAIGTQASALLMVAVMLHEVHERYAVCYNRIPYTCVLLIVFLP